MVTGSSVTRTCPEGWGLSLTHIEQRSSEKLGGWFKVSQVDLVWDSGPLVCWPERFLPGLAASPHSLGVCGREALTPKEISASICCPVAGGMADWMSWEFCQTLQPGHSRAKDHCAMRGRFCQRNAMWARGPSPTWV